jgi:hypothetical protein
MPFNINITGKLMLKRKYFMRRYSLIENIYRVRVALILLNYRIGKIPLKNHIYNMIFLRLARQDLEIKGKGGF